VSAEERTDHEMLWLNYRKALTAQIRLKHSLRADNEINRTIHKAKIEFEKQLQQGILPAPPDFAKALSE